MILMEGSMRSRVKVMRISTSLHRCCRAKVRQPFVTRTLSTTARVYDPATESTTSTTTPDIPPASSHATTSKAAAQFRLPVLDPNTAFDRRSERILNRSGTPPIGSRRRRAAVASTSQIPFEQLPYQCFQEARKVLMEDRQQKIAQITMQRERIERLKATSPVGEAETKEKMRRLKNMRTRLEELKVLADINDPLVKKRFEDDQGDLSRPIYRHLARQKFLSRRQLILSQRIQQFHLVPDIVPALDPTYDVSLSFSRATKIAPGDFVPSLLSVRPPKLQIQPFDRGERLVTIAVLDPDVPDVENDTFKTRIHFLACNIPISPVDTTVRLADYILPTTASNDGNDQVPNTTDSAFSAHTVRPWTPPYAQKGSPYHRLCVMVIEQPRTDPLDDEPTETTGSRNHEIDVLKLRQRLDEDVTNRPERMVKNPVKLIMAQGGGKAVSAFVFRTVWDEGTDGVMEKFGVERGEAEEVGIELKRKRVEPLPYKKKDGSRYR